MIRTLAPGVVLGLFMGSCGGSARPCSQCPHIAGLYQVVYDDAAGSTSSACAGDPSGPLALTQVGSSLNGVFGGVEITGTLYDSFDLTLSGVESLDAGEVDSLSIHGRYIPPAGDGGAWITGSVNVLEQASASSRASPCTLDRPFMAYPQ